MLVFVIVFVGVWVGVFVEVWVEVIVLVIVLVGVIVFVGVCVGVWVGHGVTKQSSQEEWKLSSSMTVPSMNAGNADKILKHSLLILMKVPNNSGFLESHANETFLVTWTEGSQQSSRTKFQLLHE